jgi:hypothetical protein
MKSQRNLTLELDETQIGYAIMKATLVLWFELPFETEIKPFFLTILDLESRKRMFVQE